MVLPFGCCLFVIKITISKDNNIKRKLITIFSHDTGTNKLDISEVVFGKAESEVSQPSQVQVYFDNYYY